MNQSSIVNYYRQSITPNYFFFFIDLKKKSMKAVKAKRKIWKYNGQLFIFY